MHDFGRETHTLHLVASTGDLIEPKIKGLFTEFFIESWEALWRAIIDGHRGGFLQANTS